MKPWRGLHREVRGVWRSLRYDLRGSVLANERPTEELDVHPAGRDRRPVAAAVALVLLLAGAAGVTYVAIAGGLGALIGEGPGTMPLPPRPPALPSPTSAAPPSPTARPATPPGRVPAAGPPTKVRPAPRAVPTPTPAPTCRCMTPDPPVPTTPQPTDPTSGSPPTPSSPAIPPSGSAQP